MKRIIDTIDNDSVGEDESDYSYGKLGLVLNVPIDFMPDVLRKLREIPGVKVIYQRKSVGLLRIIDYEP
ncbi:MAG: hypothetical protein ISF22_10600 [Methanomassiliicoccus sp.]|nr:hypothetical protein [Methanomassiliicoccus sp.]